MSDARYPALGLSHVREGSADLASGTRASIAASRN